MNTLALIKPFAVPAVFTAIIILWFVIALGGLFMIFFKALLEAEEESHDD
jgi:hypothetical protein